jgi:molybdopterin synthase catalytic subunit
MAIPVCEVLLTEAALESGKEIPRGSGAVVDFLGAVRPIEQGREIEGIDYEANWTMAEHQLRRIGDEAANQFGLHSIVIHHRLGFVPIQEASVFVRVTSQNRPAAYQASQWIMEELKKRVPIWKRPKFKSVAATENLARKVNVMSQT